MTYTNNGNFINWVLPINELILLECKKHKKHFLRFSNLNEHDNSLLCSKTGIIGQLSDLLEVPRNIMKDYIKKGDKDSINKIISKQPNNKKIQLNASKLGNDYWIFAFSTEKHKIVTHTEIKKIVNSIIPNCNEHQFNSVKVWEKKITSIENNQDKFDVQLRITSGTNTKSSAIKVIIYIRVHSCNNSMIACSYTSIKRLENWEDKLVQTLKEAVNLTETISMTLLKGSEELDLDDALNYINNIQLTIKDPVKINKIRKLLRKRLNWEFHKNNNANRFGLSQTLSYVGTHSQSEESSQYTLNHLQELSYESFIIPLIN